MVDQLLLHTLPVRVIHIRLKHAGSSQGYTYSQYKNGSLDWSPETKKKPRGSRNYIALQTFLGRLTSESTEKTLYSRFRSLQSRERDATEEFLTWASF